MCVHVWLPEGFCNMRTVPDVGSSETGVISNCEPPNVGAENQILAWAFSLQPLVTEFSPPQTMEQVLTWSGGTWAGGPPHEWLQPLFGGCNQRALGWGPGRRGCASELDWWPGPSIVWCNAPWQLRHSHSTWWRRCGHSLRQTKRDTGWQWTWAARMFGMTLWLLPFVVDHILTVLCVKQKLSKNGKIKKLTK